MSNADLGPILDDLAAGRIDAAEAGRRIEAAKQAAAGAGSATTGSSEQDTTTKGGPQAGGLSRVSVTAVGRRVRIEGDPSVTTLSIDGPHALRRVGTVMEVTSTEEIGPTLRGFSVIRPPRSLDDLRDIGLGKELVVRVNPRLIVDAEVPAADVEAALVEGAGELLESISLFDVYTGEQAGEGKKSLAFALRFRAERTLTDAEAAEARQRAVAVAVERFGAVQRA